MRDKWICRESILLSGLSGVPRSTLSRLISTLPTSNPDLTMSAVLSPSPSTLSASPSPSRRDRRTTISSVHSSTRSSVNISAATTALSSSSSSLAVGETIGTEQRPRFLQPALSTPTFPDEKGIYSLICSTTIRAPLQLLLAVMLDTRTYARWNAFCPGARVTHQPRSTSPLPACLRGSPAVDAIANLPWTLRDGTAFAMDVCLDPTNQSKKTSMPNLEVSHLEQFLRPATPSSHGEDTSGDGRVGVRLAWRIRGKVANLLTRSERVQEFVVDPAEPAVTEYVCWETYYGALATGMRHMYGRQIKEDYSAWMDGLKAFAEEEWQRQEQMGPDAPREAPPQAKAASQEAV